MDDLRGERWSKGTSGIKMSVTTNSVMEGVHKFLGESQNGFFTTSDIASFMGVDEYQVRAAISWLAKSRMVEVVHGVRSRRYTRKNGEAYSVAVYQMREHESKPDFAMLNLVFCRF
jgi:Mn-dependent DtxR family transcriptional regulator